MTTLFRLIRVRPVLPLVAGVLAALSCAGGGLRAEGLKKAEVSRVFNDVKLVPDNQPPRPAVVSDVVTGKAAVQTGTASRTELTFSDKTLTRLGANSLFSFANGTRDMTLGNGTMLLQVPKGAGGAQIHTLAVTAAITGTTLMVEFNPKSFSKIVVLEGTVRVSLTGHAGENMLVHAGQMIIVPAGAKALPEPVSVNLKNLCATSGLINDFGPLPSNQLIAQQIEIQNKEISSGRLQSTPLFIAGSGAAVRSASLSYLTEASERITAQQTSTSPLAVGTQSGSSSSSSSASKYGPLPDIAGNDKAQPAVYDINSTTKLQTDPSIMTNGVLDTGRIYRAGTVTFNQQTGAASTSSPDGLPSLYLLGAVSTVQFSLDPQTLQPITFDAYAGMVGDIAAFRFNSLALLGTPASISATGGPANLALIADNSISDSSTSSANTSSVFNLDGLAQVLLATRQGSINLSKNTTFEDSNNSVTTLSLFAQGGALDLGAAATMKVGGGIILFSDNGMTLNGVAQGAEGVLVGSEGSVTTGATSSLISSNASVALTSNGPIMAGGAIRAGGPAEIIAEGPNAVTVDGTITVSGISASSGASVISNGGNITLNGSMSAPGQCNITENRPTGGDITVAAGAAFTSTASSSYITSRGGSVAIDGSGQSYGSLEISALDDINAGATARLVSTDGEVFARTVTGAVTFSGSGQADQQFALDAAGDVSTTAQARLVSRAGAVYLYSTAGTVTNGGTINALGTAYLEGATDVVQNGSVTGTGGVQFLSSANLTDTGSVSTPGVALLQADGSLDVTGAMLNADTLKLQTFGSNATLTISGSSVLTGKTQLTLYAGNGSAGGEIVFAANTILSSSAAAELTAAVIKIDNNVTVTIKGPTALLYANTLDFSGSGGNGSTTGTFGGAGAMLAGSDSDSSASAVPGSAIPPKPAAVAANRPGKGNPAARPVVTAVKPAGAVFDGRYGLAALVARAAPTAGSTTARTGIAGPRGATATTRTPAPARVPIAASPAIASR